MRNTNLGRDSEGREAPEHDDCRSCNGMGKLRVTMVVLATGEPRPAVHLWGSQVPWVTCSKCDGTGVEAPYNAKPANYRRGS